MFLLICLMKTMGVGGAEAMTQQSGALVLAKDSDWVPNTLGDSQPLVTTIPVALAACHLHSHPLHTHRARTYT